MSNSSGFNTVFQNMALANTEKGNNEIGLWESVNHIPDTLRAVMR